MRKIFSLLTAILFAGSMMATDVAVTIHASSGDYYAKTNSWQNGTQYNQVVLDENITANLIGTGNNGKYYSDWRFYTSGSDAGSFSIDAAEGYELQSIKITWSAGNSGALYMGDTKVTSNTAYEVSGQKVVLQCKNTNTATNGQAKVTKIAVTYQAASAPAVKYYMKNNWDAAADWTWKEMTKDGDNYKLESVVFGGTGVNYNTAESDEGAAWVPVADIAGDKLAAKDTVNLVLAPTTGTVTAAIVGKYVEPVTPPTPVDSMTVYFVNVPGWTAVNAYVWPAEGAAYKTWPGEAMTPVNTQINEKDVYAYTFPASNVNIIFNNGTTQTEDLKWAADAPYFYDGKWYAKENIPAPSTPPTPVDSMTVYLVNTLDWTAVNAFVWPAEGNAYKEWPGEAMTPVNTQINGKDVYAYTFPASYVNVIFNNGTVQTVDLKWAADAPYFLPGEMNEQSKYEGKWYAKENIPAPADQITPVPVANYIVHWDATPENVVGQVILHAGAAAATTKIHTNKDNLDAINLSKSYKYADDQYVVIKPATGAFKAGDVVEFATLINNATGDGSKYGRVQFYAADGATKLFEGQDGINGRLVNDEPIVEQFTLEADQDSILLGRYGNTATFVSILNVGREGGVVPPVVAAKYYITGDSALVVDAGLAAEKAWDPMAIKSETDTFALSLKANQEYKLKLIEDGDWKGGKVYGYDALTVKADGLSADADGNIVFKLNTASAVQVVYFWEEVATDDWKMTFKLLGDFYVAPEPPVEEHTYTVAGGSDIAFGTKWAPDNTANDMVKQEDGTYKWEKTELTLPAGAIEFKVCEDHAWTTSWPAQNYSLAIAEAGIYTITITFNPAAEENKVAAVATKTGSAVVDPTVAAKGSWDGWAKELNFVLAQDKKSATLTVEDIKAGTYEFKVILNGSDWRSNGHEYNRGYTGAEGITGNDSNNMKIVADVDGTYSFTWTFATNALNITFPKTGTGIDNTADGIKAVKVIRDGQLLIIKGEKTFNTQGQLVK